VNRLLRPLFSAAIVGGVAFLVYLPALSGGFVFDDSMLLVENEHVHSLESPGRFFADPDTLSRHGALHSYRPLRTLMFAVEWSLFGDRPFGYRLVSALLHALASVAVLLLLRRWTALPRGALLGALLFAVHPIGTECVPWTSIQGDILMVAALLLALLCLDEPRPGRVIAGAALFAIAAGSKESAVVLPVLLLIRWHLLPRSEGSSRRWVVSLTVLIVLGIAYTVLRQAMVTSVASETAAHRPFYGGSWWATAGAFLSGCLYYAGTLLFPIQMTVRWAPCAPPAGAGEVLLLLGGIALVLGLVTAAVVWRRRCPHGSSGLLMALVSLGPASSLLVPLPAMTEVRYLYPILPFLVLALVPALERVRLRPALLMLIALAALTVKREREWESPDALWTAALDRPRSTPEAIFNVGVIRLDAARGHLDAGRARAGLRDLHEARGLLLAYAERRLPEARFMAPEERRDLSRCLADTADLLLRAGLASEAVDPAWASVNVPGERTPERLRLLAAALAAAGLQDDAEQFRREAEGLEGGPPPR
jgi:hypothetical protein